MKNLLLLCALLGAACSYAGGRDIGNGGYVLICGEQVELLDSYEARVNHKMPLDFGVEQDETVAARVEAALQKVKAFDPDFESILRAQTSKLLTLVEGVYDESKLHADVAVKIGVVFEGTADFGDLWRPQGCELARVANQAKPNFPHERFYTFRKDLWTRLNPDQQAMLIVHEAVYHFLASLGQTTSVKTRFLSGYLSSAIGWAKVSNLKDYIELSQLVGRTQITHRGVRCQINQPTDYTFNHDLTRLNSCKLSSGVAVNLGSIATDAIAWMGNCKAENIGENEFSLVWQTHTSSTWATFHENVDAKTAVKKLLTPRYVDNDGTFRIQKPNGKFLSADCAFQRNPFATIDMNWSSLSIELSEDGQLVEVLSSNVETPIRILDSEKCEKNSIGTLTMSTSARPLDDLEQRLLVRVAFDKDMLASRIDWTPSTAADDFGTIELLKYGLSGYRLSLDKNQAWSFSLNKNGCAVSTSGPFEGKLMSVTEMIDRPFYKQVLFNGAEPKNRKTSDGLVEYPFELRMALSATGQKLSIRLVDSKNPNIRPQGLEVNVGKISYGQDKSAEIWADGSEPMALNVEGQILQATLSRPISYKNKSGKNVTIPAGTRVTLDKNGEIDKNTPQQK